MIIDTELFTKSLEKNMSDRASSIDVNTKSDAVACRLLTNLEADQISAEKTLNDMIRLYKFFCRETGPFWFVERESFLEGVPFIQLNEEMVSKVEAENILKDYKENSKGSDCYEYKLTCILD